MRDAEGLDPGPFRVPLTRLDYPGDLNTQEHDRRSFSLAVYVYFVHACGHDGHTVSAESVRVGRPARRPSALIGDAHSGPPHQYSAVSPGLGDDQAAHLDGPRRIVEVGVINDVGHRLAHGQHDFLCRRLRPIHNSCLGLAADRPLVTLATTRCGGAVIVTVGGEVDWSTADRWREAVIAALDGRATGPVIVDLREVTFRAAAGLHALLSARQHAIDLDELLRS